MDTGQGTPYPRKAMMYYITLLTALMLSGVAEYFSIMGLIAIFASAPISAAVMGGSLGIAKLVAASWVYHNWVTAPRLLKYYFTVSVIALSAITSMGIFGYLSKAHTDQSLVSGDVTAKISIYDEKIKTAKENIDANRKALQQMDEAVDQVMARSTSETGADKAVAVRRNQQKERRRLLAEIETYQKTISVLAEERAPIAAEVRKVEAEVGPLKYIAALLYGNDTDTFLLEKAIRWIIIVIVMVFDPMAILLLIAANFTKKQQRGEVITAVSKPDAPVTNYFEEDPKPQYVADVTMPEPESRSWSKEMYRRIRQEIPKEIMDKVSKK